MKIKNTISLILIGTLIFSIPVSAAENTTVSMQESELSEEYSSCENEEPDTFENEEADAYENEEEIVFVNEAEIELDDFDAADNIEFTEMISNVDISEMDTIFPSTNADNAVSAYSLSADAYEPNDTMETAYNYAKIPEINGTLYNTGFKSANLHTVTDEDWYYTTLTAGNTYFLDLRNIGSTTGFNISLLYFNDDNTFDYITSIGDSRFSDRPEKYYYFRPNKSGKYYVLITGDGVHTSALNYFFYIGDVQRTFTYTKSVGNVTINGNTYQTAKRIDLTGVVVPLESIVLSMSFSNDFSGTQCYECQKKVTASDGKSYYSSSSGDTDILNISRYQYLDQVWMVSGRCTDDRHTTTWKPTMTAKYSCIMQPYPGNEVD